MTQAIIPGSIGALAKQQNKSIAETFLSCDVIVIVDTSGSMDTNDSRGGRSRYQVACEELADLQNSLPGKIAVIAFSDEVMFCPDGKPWQYRGGTLLAKALRFAKTADISGMKFILISDGEPHDESDSLRVAQTYTNRIDVIYVGPKEHPAGREFLQRLAQASGGQMITADRVKELASEIQFLLKA
jgi:uncharacterized protein with von Willebrand factor type A (vWA) domain